MGAEGYGFQVVCADDCEIVVGYLTHVFFVDDSTLFAMTLAFARTMVQAVARSAKLLALTSTTASRTGSRTAMVGGRMGL